MLGCLGNFIKAIVIILAVIGFLSIGGVTFFKDSFNNIFSGFQSIQKQNAEAIADFSGLDKEFEIISSGKIPKIGNFVYIRHGVSSQKFYLLQLINKETLTKADFSSKDADEKIISFAEKLKILQLENFKITNRGTFSAKNQQIPYVKIEANIANIPLKGIEGVIASADYNDENVIIITINSAGKYSQIITEVLLKEIN